MTRYFRTDREEGDVFAIETSSRWSFCAVVVFRSVADTVRESRVFDTVMARVVRVVLSKSYKSRKADTNLDFQARRVVIVVMLETSYHV